MIWSNNFSNPRNQKTHGTAGSSTWNARKEDTQYHRELTTPSPVRAWHPLHSITARPSFQRGRRRINLSPAAGATSAGESILQVAAW